jgi:hypothetical protein
MAVLIGKQISFSDWKLWRARREIDLQRIADDLMPQVIGPEKQDIDTLIKVVETLKELKLIKSLGLRVSDNDTLEIIQRQMKAKALRFIKNEGL